MTNFDDYPPAIACSDPDTGEQLHNGRPIGDDEMFLPFRREFPRPTKSLLDLRDDSKKRLESAVNCIMNPGQSR